MNSVALPASATAPTLSTEGDLVRLAARGEAEAFAELFRRHGQMAWRVAQAVAINRDAAVAAVGNGCARSLRGMRRRQPDAEAGFRTVLLAAVYRAAMEDARAHAGSATPNVIAPAPAVAGGSKAARARAKSNDAVLVEAAFRSLPERWRAAMWLSEVEAMTTDRVAPILGVSTAVATQLINRGTRGFEGRFAQARRPVPEHLDAALRQVGLAMPTNLADAVAVRLKAISSDPGLRFAPITAWLSERAARPLQVAVGGLLGMGLIGIGLVGQGSSVRTGPVATPLPTGGTSPGVTQPFFRAGSPSGPSNPGGLNFTSGVGSGPSTAAATTTAAGTATTPTTSGGSSSGGTTHTTQPPGGSTGSPGGGTTTPPGGGTTTPPGSGTGTPPPKTIVPLAPVATVTQSGAAITANVLPTKTGSTLSLTIGCSTGLGLTVGTTTIGCKAPGTTTSPATSPTTPTTSPTLVGGLLTGVGKTLSGL